MDHGGRDLVVDDVGPDQWRRWRELRLRALASDPDVFGSTLSRERDLDEADWRRLLAEGPRVVAARAGVDVGIAGAHLADGPDRPRLFGLWVDPGHRGHDVGRALVEAVVARLRAGGHDHVRLWVTSANDHARDLYVGTGFAVESDPPPGPRGCEVAMVRAWSAGS